MASKYEIIIEGSVKSGTIESAISKIEKSLSLNINKVQITQSGIDTLQAQLNNLKLNLNVNLGGKGTGAGGGTGGGGTTPGTAPIFIDTTADQRSIDQLQKRIQQIRASIKGAPVKFEIFTQVNKSGEEIKRAVLNYNDLAGNAKTLTMQWVKVLQDVNGQLQEVEKWQNTNNKYVDDGIKKERDRQKEIEKFAEMQRKAQAEDIARTEAAAKRKEAIIKRMNALAESALAKTYGRKQDVPEVQNVITQVENLKSAIASGDVKKMEEFATKTRTAVTQMGNLGKNTLNWSQSMKTALEKIAQWGIATTLIYGTLQQFRQAKEYIMDLNKELTNTRLVTGMTAEAASSLSGEYSKLAKDLGATTLEVARGALEWQRQGKSVEETTMLLKNSMMMSKLGNIEAAESTEKLTAIINGFNLSAEESIRVVDVLVQLDNNYATSVDEIASAMQRSSNSAQMVGIEFNELASYITLVSSTTRKSAESIGESFKTIFARMRNVKLGKLFDEEGESISDVEKTLTHYGIALRDAEGQFRDFSDVLKETAALWETVGTTEKSAIAGAFAGTRQSENFIVFMNQWDEIQKAQELATDSVGLAEKRYAIYMESMAAKTNELRVAWESLASSTIQSGLLNFGADLGIMFLGLIEKIKIFNIMWVAIAAGFGRILMIVPAITASMNALAASITLVNISATALSMIIAGGVGIALLGLYWLFQKLNVTMKESYQIFEDEKATLNSNKTELASLASEYEDLANKTHRTSEETSRLVEIQSILNTKFGASADGMDGFSDATTTNTEKIKENVKWLQEQQRIQNEIFLKQQKDEYEKAKSFLSDSTVWETDLSMEGGFAGTALEYRKELQKRLATEEDILETNEKTLENLNQQISAAENLILGYEDIERIRREQTSGRGDYRSRGKNRDVSRTPEFIKAEEMDAATAEANKLEGAYADLAAMVSGTLSKSFDDFAKQQDELGVKLATLRAKLKEAQSYSPKTPEGLEKQRVEINNLQKEIGETSLAMEENAKVHEMATRRILFDMILQRIEQAKLTGEVADAAYDMAFNLAESWGLVDARTAEAMSHISGAINNLSTQDVPTAVAALQNLGAWANAVAGDYSIRFNVYTVYSQVSLPQGGDPKTGYPPGYEPEPPDDPGGYYPGGFDAPSSGGAAAPQEPTYSASTLYGMIIDLIRQQKQEEIDLLKVKQDALRLEQDNLETQQDALDKQLDAYGKIIDARKEMLQEQRQELEYAEEIADRNKSIGKLKDELAVLKLDDSLESKARQLEIQESLDAELEDLAKTQRDHSYDEQEKALDKEYTLYEESINREKAILQQRYDMLEVEYELVQKEIDAIEEFLSKPGLLGQDALKQIEKMSPELYAKLIEWNKVYGSGIDEDITRAWNEAAKAVQTYGDIVDAIRGTSDFDGGVAGGGGGTNLNWKRRIGLVEGTALWAEALELGREKFLAKYPQYQARLHHTGLDSGPVGAFHTPTNDVFAQLMKGEMVLSESDMLGIMKNKIPALAQTMSRISESGPSLSIGNLINVEGNVDKNVVLDLDRVADKVVGKINSMLLKRGYTRGGQVFST